MQVRASYIAQAFRREGRDESGQVRG